MSRLSFRPRPLDIHKKLPIVKSIKDFEDEETISLTRNSQLQRLAAEADNEVHQTPSKKIAPEIPIPQFVVVDTYERDYSCTFSQPTSYLRARGVRAEIGDFVEYDLDNEDEDWLQELNNERKILSPEKFESILFKLEVLDHKARERAGIITPTLGSPIPVILQAEAAFEAVQSQSIRQNVFQSVYAYWKRKREWWQKPILRRLQPPPPANDTNPYNVFRPREKAHRLHTRRMQRRENNVQSFEKLRQVRRNFDQAKIVLEALIKREEKKRDVMEGEINLQRMQMKYKQKTQLVEDNLALPGFMPLSGKFASSEDDFSDSDDMANCHTRVRAFGQQNTPFTDSRPMTVPTGRVKQELRRRHLSHGWFPKRDPLEPVLLFTRPLDPEKLAAAGILPPSSPLTENGESVPPCHLHGRIGRGGRVIFDRWRPLLQSPLGYENPSYVPPNPGPPLFL